MTFFSLTWLESGIIFLLGAAVGAIIFAVLSRKYNASTPARDSKPVTESEFVAYENAVNNHLLQTTELLQQLGADYQNIIDHVREGIHELGKSTFEGHNIMPHFPLNHAHRPNTKNESAEMPKTYIDPNKENKE